MSDIKTKNKQINEPFNKMVNECSLIENKDFYIHLRITIGSGKCNTIHIDVYNKNLTDLHQFWIYFDDKEVSSIEESVDCLIDELRNGDFRSIGYYNEAFGGML